MGKKQEKWNQTIEDRLTNIFNSSCFDSNVMFYFLLNYYFILFYFISIFNSNLIWICSTKIINQKTNKQTIEIQVEL